MLKTPKFWQNINIISIILSPLSVIYWLIFTLLQLTKTIKKTSKKTICIGNITAGGAGKTPLAIKIGQILNSHNQKFAYLSRGYSRKTTNFIKVNPKKHQQIDVGDEPLLLAQISNSYVTTNRSEDIKKIPEKNIILDDGMQDFSFKKDLNILVIDGSFGFGNNLPLPAGPLRQTLKNAQKFIQLAVIIEKDKKNITKKLKNIPIFNAFITTNQKLSGNYLAFCAIANPNKFFDFLTSNNAKLKEKLTFADHYSYQKDDVTKIINQAKSKNLKIITTKKDWIKLPKNYQKQIDFLDIDLKINNYQQFEKIILKTFK